MRTSKKVLIILSAVVWYIGGIMLFRSGFELLLLSTGMRPGENWPWVFIGLGVLLGVFQASMIFNRSCRKNITRIRQLEDPRIWQFFRPGFFLALAIMISSGILLNHLSQGQYFFMLTVAAVDFALTISLLGSSYVFWTEKLPSE
jgi:hypothetical protein